MATNTKRKRVDADDDGNDLTPPPPDSPAGQIMYLLEWGRQRGFQIGPRIQIGDVTLEAWDLRRTKQNAAPEDRGIWAAHGHDEKEE